MGHFNYTPTLVEGIPALIFGVPNFKITHCYREANKVSHKLVVMAQGYAVGIHEPFEVSDHGLDSFLHDHIIQLSSSRMVAMQFGLVPLSSKERERERERDYIILVNFTEGPCFFPSVHTIEVLFFSKESVCDLLHFF